MLHLLSLLLLSAAPVVEWNFDDNTAGTWLPNGHLAEINLSEGVLHCKGIGHDPFFNNREMNFAATPWQCVKLRVRATKPSRAELFWSGTLDGDQGGLSQSKATSFQVPGDGAWHEVVVFPFWHREQNIRQLRLDLYDGADFSLDWIRVEDWAEGRIPLETADSLPMLDWQGAAAPETLFAPPLNIGTEKVGWITLELDSSRNQPSTLLWATDAVETMQEEVIELTSGQQTVNIEMQGLPGWQGRLVALGLRRPPGVQVNVKNVWLRELPGGPADLQVTYLGSENALNRSGKAFPILASIKNMGGETITIEELSLKPMNGLEIISGPDPALPQTFSFGEPKEFRWMAQMQTGEACPNVSLSIDGAAVKTGEVCVASALALTPADYVPAPQPVPTSTDVAMYYFPGWDNVADWDPVRRSARNRKPLLGYYDEALPEVVDWQIKWARENGVSCFLVDWYWVAGSKHLEHWFNAYRKAEYRDQLDVAIMWANHNPPNTHSREDWRAVTKEWIDRYFNLPAYYKIEGKPAIFLWDPSNLRRDLGSSEEVRAALDESREMARGAGYEGIYFATLFGHETPAGAKQLADEGYDGMTNYHEWGRADTLAKDPKQLRFEDVVSTAPSVWEEKEAYSGDLDYFPVADTGWDARPWHGNKSMVISGRKPALFRDLLEQLRNFAQRHNTPLVVLGPANEWGEGSYVEPCTEFGFDMMEAIRSAFATSPAHTWPQNFGPADVGLGGYDLPEQPPTRRWSFDKDAGGWSAMMGIDKFSIVDSALHFTTVTTDPALVVSLRDITAASASALSIRLTAKADGQPELHAQLFWAVGQGGTSEATSLSFTVTADGLPRIIRIPLAGHPRWRGQITQLRLDPASAAGVEFDIDEIRFED